MESAMLFFIRKTSQIFPPAVFLSKSLSCSLDVNFLAVRIDSSTSVGPLLVYQDGAWGYVCDYEFDDVDAQVACRQLGYAVRNPMPLCNCEICSW